MLLGTSIVFIFTLKHLRLAEAIFILYSYCGNDVIACCFTSKQVLALDLEGVHDVKLHHPSSSVATSNQ